MRGNHLRSSRPANSMEQDSFDSFDDIEDMLVMNTANLNLESGSEQLDPSGNTGDELPKSLIVTNVDLKVFDNEDIKSNFETMFREFDTTAAFHYLRSFRRIRIDFESHFTAAAAKANLDNTPLSDNVIHIYFIQVLSPCPEDEAYLSVPPPSRQFLISPPASPPVGWEQPREGKPIVNYDLLAAMAALKPGAEHELHPSKQISVLGKSVSTPSIVVHVCDDPKVEPKGGKKIPQTRCPERKSSLDL